MKGQEGASEITARKIAKKLDLSKTESETFIVSMNAQYARSKKSRQIAQDELASMLHAYRPLNVQAFKLIADWYNLAVLSLIETKGFLPKISFIARRLEISVYEAKGAIDRLLALEMISPNPENSFSATGVFFANPGGTPSQSVRSFHRQILQKASDALDRQTVDERDYSTLVLAVDPQN